eukprot:TRINITY_DN5353_c0_g1_i2.p1 TRINITY_DN5353_c0_g1~~TRINITY_DN5353_c0_g1_i2.p1  ORF type:complete len:320 (-),score=39.45 TRINITY_DN5353_c0_g1_i2:137-1039(-)
MGRARAWMSSPTSRPASVGGRRRVQDISPRRRVEGLRRRRTVAGESRRRSADIYGGANSVQNSDAHRRRVAYGYTTNQGVMNNYNGNVPQKSSYGFTGQAAKKGSKMKIAMGVAAGFAAGAAVGVGGYYVYNRMSNKNWGGDYRDRSWCSAPGGGTMTCNDCYQRYGSNACLNENQCFSAQGCNYKMQKDTVRDDIMATGVVPQDFTAPFTLTITKIVGDDFAASDICPAKQPDDVAAAGWEKASSFSNDLFVTLSEMDVLEVNSGSNDNVISSSTALSPSLLPCLLLVFVFMRWIRVCG